MHFNGWWSLKPEYSLHHISCQNFFKLLTFAMKIAPCIHLETHGRNFNQGRARLGKVGNLECTGGKELVAVCGWSLNHMEQHPFPAPPQICLTHNKLTLPPHPPCFPLFTQSEEITCMLSAARNNFFHSIFPSPFQNPSTVTICTEAKYWGLCFFMSTARKEIHVFRINPPVFQNQAQL